MDAKRELLLHLITLSVWFFSRVHQEKLAPQVPKEPKVVLDLLVCQELPDPEEMLVQRYEKLV